MKIRPLPITDLARIAVLPLGMQRPALEQVKSGGRAGSYRPTREKLPDIVNRHPGVFESERASWSVVEKDIKMLSRSDEEEKMNLLTAKSIYDFCHEEKINARELDGFPLSFAIGLKLTCWAPALFLYPDRISVPFFDMRRRYGLTPAACKFMFSAMHLALRENNPDYESVTFEILRLSDSKRRTIRPVPENGMELFSYEQLEELVVDTHELWIEVQIGRSEDRRRGGREVGPDDLFGR
jgi:hypothetical protein